MSSFGNLSICCGCMFSGKTSWLMQQYKKYSYIGKKITVVNYDQDQRYHNSLLSTHDKIMIPCIQAHKLKDVYQEMIESDVILINEGHAYEYDGGKKKKFVAEIETEKAAKKEDLVDKPAEE